MIDHVNMPKTVAIAGLGQMGFSLALALKEADLCERLIAWSPFEEEVLAVSKLGVFEQVSINEEEIFSQADLTILCMPVPALVDFAKNKASIFKSGSIVTDISSVKTEVVNKARPSFVEAGIHFIGSHPMCGSEKSGHEHSRSDLYKNRIVFVTSFCTDDPAACNILREFWRSLEARPIEVDASLHDDAVAHSSHMLHIMASSISKVVLSGHNKDLKALACAGGFRDFSRIASSSPQMWTEVTRLNKEAVLRSLDEVMAEMQKTYDAVKYSDWDALYETLDEAKELRDNWWNNIYQS